MPKTQTMMRKAQVKPKVVKPKVVKPKVVKVKTKKNMKKNDKDKVLFEHFKKCFQKVLEADVWRSKKEGDSYKPNEARDKIKEYHQDMFDMEFIWKRKTWDRPYKFYRAMNEICGLVIGAMPIYGTHIHGKCAIKCLIHMLNRHSTEERVPVYPEIVHALGFGFTDVHPQTKQFIANRDDANDYYLFPCDEISRVYKDFSFSKSGYHIQDTIGAVRKVGARQKGAILTSISVKYLGSPGPYPSEYGKLGFSENEFEIHGKPWRGLCGIVQREYNDWPAAIRKKALVRNGRTVGLVRRYL